MSAVVRVLFVALFVIACSQSDTGGGNSDSGSGARAGDGGAGMGVSGMVASGAGGRGGNGGTNAGSGGDSAGGDGGSMDGSLADGSIADGSTMDAMSGDSGGGMMDASRADAGFGDFALPPVNGDVDYQLGGGYTPPAGVATVARDRTDAIAPGKYNICYVNGFQVQPGEDGIWDDDLILRDESGAPVIDEDWNEALLDVGTPDKRTRIAAVVNGFIDGCAGKGFDAIEIDNLDSYSRSDGRLSESNAVDFMALLSAHAHSKGLAIAQKNSTELLDRRLAMGTDFAVAEECSQWDECADYIEEYGPNVLMIEYRQQDFAEGCASFGDTHPIVLRDLDLVTPADGNYVFDGC